MGTWNVNGRAPPPDLDLRPFINVASNPDVVVVGFQEIVPLTAGNVLSGARGGGRGRASSHSHGAAERSALPLSAGALSPDSTLPTLALLLFHIAVESFGLTAPWEILLDVALNGPRP